MFFIELHVQWSWVVSYELCLRNIYSWNIAFHSEILKLLFTIRKDFMLSIYFHEFLHKLQVVKFWKFSLNVIWEVIERRGGTIIFGISSNLSKETERTHGNLIRRNSMRSEISIRKLSSTMKDRYLYHVTLIMNKEEPWMSKVESWSAWR